MSVSFISMLLRAAIYLETTVACKIDLEKRMALQLGHAVLDDLLIPSYSGDTLFDVETVERIVMNFLESEIDVNGRSEVLISPSISEMEGVTRLMESYLAEIASDRNLSVAKFLILAELIPEKSRITEDGMYRAIDIYLKAHPDVSEMDRKKVCSVMECEKLSRSACAHAAQNERLPVQTVVQVLYYEQQRLRDGNMNEPQVKNEPFSIDIHPVSDELSRLRKENEELKVEIGKVKMRMKEMERSSHKDKSSGGNSPLKSNNTPSRTAEKPPLPKKSLLGSVTKKLGKLIVPPQSTRIKPSKDRRHFVS